MGDRTQIKSGDLQFEELVSQVSALNGTLLRLTLAIEKLTVGFSVDGARALHLPVSDGETSCNGVVAQGKSAYLSEKNESDQEEPVIPKFHRGKVSGLGG